MVTDSGDGRGVPQGVGSQHLDASQADGLGRLQGVGPKALRLLAGALAARRAVRTTSQHDGAP